MNHDKKFGFGAKGSTRCLLTAFILLAVVCGVSIVGVQPVSAAKKSVIVGMTQEPVNFNALYMQQVQQQQASAAAQDTAH